MDCNFMHLLLLFRLGGHLIQMCSVLNSYQCPQGVKEDATVTLISYFFIVVDKVYSPGLLKFLVLAPDWM